MLILLSLFIILNFFLFLLAIHKLRHSRKKVELIYQWAFLFGAFTWEDMMVFGLFDIFLAIITLLVKDLRIGLLIWACFWIVRGTGEMIYWFLQQFSQPSRYPHNQYQDMKAIHFITGKVSLQQVFIIFQVFYEVLITFFIAGLILLLRDWANIGPWF